MSKKELTIDLLIAVLLALIVVAEMCLAIKICQVDAETERAEKVMSEAQERIDAYYASLPARERPVVVSVAPVVTVEPMAEPKAPDEPETPEWYIEDIPLDKQLQHTAFDAANENGVDYLLALAVMSEESEFDSTAVSACGCYGLMQLNPRYFPSGLSDEDNIKSGVAYLGELLKQYKGDEPAALRAYNLGFDDGDRVYSNTVLDTREEIMRKAGVTFP